MDSGAPLVQALDRLQTGQPPPTGRSAGRAALLHRSYAEGIAWWGARLAEALDHAHDRGVLHRDIKPSNVLVTSDGMPMLLDFNLAYEPLVQDGSAADSTTLGGTIDYMAPEHLRALVDPSSETVDGRSDIYSLGVMLFEALVGHRPFAAPHRGSSVMEALLRAADERTRTRLGPRALEPEVTPAFDAVIRRCLEPNPVDRYASAAELAADLQAVADDQPLWHAREPLSSRAAGWIRRSWRRLAKASVILVAVSAVVAAALNFLVARAEYARMVRRVLEKANAAYLNEDYHAAQKQYEAAIDLVDSFDKISLWARLTNWRNFPLSEKTLRQKLNSL
jgi:hypothetical protein